MTGDQPLVSIVTPSFNKGPYIEETIQSIKNQSYTNIEHIVIDGGSTDGTLEILKRSCSSLGNIGEITWRRLSSRNIRKSFTKKPGKVR